MEMDLVRAGWVMQSGSNDYSLIRENFLIFCFTLLPSALASKRIVVRSQPSPGYPASEQVRCCIEQYACTGNGSKGVPR